LKTDASFRFERGADPNSTVYALKRAALLIKEIAGGEISSEIIDVYPKKIANYKVPFSFLKCEQMIGKHIDLEIIKKIILSLGIEIEHEGHDALLLSVPAFKVDVTREQDVIEEVLRIYGFNNVPLPEKLNTTITLRTKPDLEKVQASLSEFLVGFGCNEMMNNSLTSSVYSKSFGNEAFGEAHNVAMLNPLSQELDVMRQTLIYSVLEVVAHNQNRQNPDLKLLEFGKTYTKIENGFNENKRLIIALTGRSEKEQWNASNENVSYFTLKGIILSLFKRLGLSSMISESALKNSMLQDGVQLAILKNKIGEMGWINSQLKKHFGIKNAVFVADLDWDAIITQLKLIKINYKELPKTFEVRRDFSLLLDAAVNYQAIEKLALGIDRKILKRMNLFDVYEGKNLDEGKKSYAVSFYFQDNEQTLKDEQIEKVMQKIKTELESKLNAQLR
jgi:phenylalanyl-tRNA synthetase beta chain